jgi:hypothetical protein
MKKLFVKIRSALAHHKKTVIVIAVCTVIHFGITFLISPWFFTYCLVHSLSSVSNNLPSAIDSGVAASGKVLKNAGKAFAYELKVRKLMKEGYTKEETENLLGPIESDSSDD